jgi:hypothetical protein
VATAQRDLAQLLVDAERVLDARAEAEEARATFERLGSWAEVEKLDALLQEASGEGTSAEPKRPRGAWRSVRRPRSTSTPEELR